MSYYGSYEQDYKNQAWYTQVKNEREAFNTEHGPPRDPLYLVPYGRGRGQTRRPTERQHKESLFM